MASGPVNVIPPSLTGVPLVGELLTVDPGQWVGEPVPGINLQWRRDNAFIANETSESYRLVDADVDAVIVVRVTAYNTFNTVQADTLPCGPIQPAPLLPPPLSEEERAALWRQQQLLLLTKRVAFFHALAAPPGPYARVREAWRPIELALAEAQSPMSTPVEDMEANEDRRNPYGCLIP